MNPTLEMILAGLHDDETVEFSKDSAKKAMHIRIVKRQPRLPLGGEIFIAEEPMLYSGDVLARELERLLRQMRFKANESIQR